MSSHTPKINLPAVLQAVQHNCDVADALYAPDDPLCIYLLKMRELFRWESGIPLDRSIDRHSLGRWMTEKETFWDDLEDCDYRAIPLGDRQIDRFDCNAINDLLNPIGLVYSGGLGRGSRPVFVVAKILRVEEASDLTIFLCEEELARCMTAPPAMSHHGKIYVRRDAFRRYLAGMVEEWGWKKLDNAMGQVVSHYAFDTEPHQALNRLVDSEIENLILHEIGERIAEDLIGEGWRTMVGNLDSPLQELKIRAVRDNLADCLSSLPAMLTFNDRASLDFYYANMTPLRRELFPSFCDAYHNAHSTGNYQPVSRVVAEGRVHWLKISKRLVADGGPGLPTVPRKMAVTKCLESCAF